MSSQGTLVPVLNAVTITVDATPAEVSADRGYGTDVSLADLGGGGSAARMQPCPALMALWTLAISRRARPMRQRHRCWSA